MSMNKEDLRALLSIAKKQDWNGKPAAEFITVTLQFSEDMGMNLSDINALPYITSSEGLQYQLECEEEEEEYDLAMVEELAWYNHARMMGWE
nr:MAG: hypothetical protein [Bacteriophage sp.]